MSALAVQQMAERVAALMEERLRLRGKGLAEKLRRSRTALPRRIRSEAAVLAEAELAARNPKLVLRLDHERIAAAYDACIRHLNGLGRWDRRRAYAAGLARSIAVQLALVALLLAAVLVWRGQR